MCRKGKEKEREGIPGIRRGQREQRRGETKPGRYELCVHAERTIWKGVCACSATVVVISGKSDEGGFCFLSCTLLFCLKFLL